MAELLLSRTIRIRALDPSGNTNIVMGLKPNDDVRYYEKVVAKNIVENIATNGPTQSVPLREQIWFMNIYSTPTSNSWSLGQGECIFQNFLTGKYMAAPDEKDQYVMTVMEENISGYDFENDPKRIVWNYKALPNWSEDDFGAPRPYILQKKADGTVLDLYQAQYAEDNPIIVFPSKGQYYEKNTIANQVWYLEPPRVLIKAKAGKPTKVTAKLKIAGQKLEIWETWLGGNRLASLEQDGATYTVANGGNFYISCKKADTNGNFINESANSIVEINPEMISIPFFYGDPETRGSAEVGDGVE